MAGAFQANAFQNDAFQTESVVTERPSGGVASRDELRHALHFWDHGVKRHAAQDVLERAATIDRLAQAAQTQQDAVHVAQMGLLRAEFLALAETRQVRDQARRLFAELVAQEVERQDAEAAFMALMIFLL